MAKLVTIYTANGQLEAEMIKTYLESQGIAAFLNQESAGTALGLTIGPLGEVNVMVTEENREEAGSFLKNMGETTDEISEDEDEDENIS